MNLENARRMATDEKSGLLPGDTVQIIAEASDNMPSEIKNIPAGGESRRRPQPRGHPDCRASRSSRTRTLKRNMTIA